jgi:hypothetical protein
MTTHIQHATCRAGKAATPDDIAGMAWWNALTVAQRGYWLQLSKSNTAAHAWDHFKLIRDTEAQS